ncbi:Lin0512 family protein [Thalassococcus lentus]|uniref:Lin0512 family protein n=1 Tax=Thalassococcus lentus TaxID=1210524 RepID=A0ABT4XRG8_9RHOB|nr:Lin0512 family protein [Thalassococcus lentus]MDA7424549.1 Lin0512 family protein [Thalassococcus lentus]
MQRLIIEMAIGTDLHGQDYTKAACRAVEQALRHASLPALSLPGMDQAEIRVHIGVQDPDRVDKQAVAACLPRSGADVTVALGGLDVAVEEGSIGAVTASAAIEVFLPKQDSWRLRPTD